MVNFNFFLRSRVRGTQRVTQGGREGPAEDIKGVMYAFSVAGFVTLGTDRWRNCPSFWARSSSQLFGFFAPVGVLANQNGAHPWFVAEVFGRVLYRVQILGMMANKDRWGEGRAGHTLIVMVGEYWGDRRRTLPPAGLSAVKLWWKRLTFSLWNEWRKFPLSSPSSLGVPGGLLMPLKLFGEFWREEVSDVAEAM